MIDPTKLPRYDFTVSELEEFALFAVAVAGKNALTTAKHLDRWLRHASGWKETLSPFDKLRTCFGKDKVAVSDSLKLHGIGCYKLKGAAMCDLIHSGLDLSSCRVEDLEALYGIGPKTARFFLLHTRKDVRVACLDTHILKYMSSLGHSVPAATPSKNKYRDIEQLFLAHADELMKTPAELDIEIWKLYSGNH